MKTLSVLTTVILIATSTSSFAKNNLDAQPVNGAPSNEARISFPASTKIQSITQLESGEWYRITISNQVPLTYLSLKATNAMILASNAVITTVSGKRYYVESFQRSGIIPVDTFFNSGEFDTQEGVAFIDLQLQSLDGVADAEISMASPAAMPEFSLNM